MSESYEAYAARREKMRRELKRCFSTVCVCVCVCADWNIYSYNEREAGNDPISPRPPPPYSSYPDLQCCDTKHHI